MSGEEEKSMEQLQVKITKLSEGLGFGDGSISGHELRGSAGAECVAAAEAIINSPAIISRVDANSEGLLFDDDGCADGRKTKKIFHGVVEKTVSKIRQKVFGGGVAMATAYEIGSGQSSGVPLQSVFSNGISALKRVGLNFGAHTADRVAAGREDFDSGCGAIDKAPEAIIAIGAHEDKVYSVLGVFGISHEEAQPVIENFKAYALASYGQDYSGRSVVERIMEEGKVVKQLEGTHVEFALVIMDIEDCTVNQAAVREATNGKLDVFATDLPRLRKIAKQLTIESTDPTAERTAFISELTYTLGVSGVITKGDLSVYLVESAKQLALV